MYNFRYDFLVYCFSLLVTIYAKCLMSWASILDIFFLCNDFLLLLFNADIKKLTESQEGSSENARFSKPLLEVSSLSLSLHLSMKTLSLLSSCYQYSVVTFDAGPDTS